MWSAQRRDLIFGFLAQCICALSSEKHRQAWPLHLTSLCSLPPTLSSAQRRAEQDSGVGAVVCQSPLNNLGQCRKGSTLSFTVAFQILRTGLFEVLTDLSCFHTCTPDKTSRIRFGHMQHTAGESPGDMHSHSLLDFRGEGWSLCKACRRNDVLEGVFPLHCLPVLKWDNSYIVWGLKAWTLWSGDLVLYKCWMETAGQETECFLSFCVTTLSILLSLFLFIHCCEMICYSDSQRSLSSGVFPSGFMTTV